MALPESRRAIEGIREAVSSQPSLYFPASSEKGERVKKYTELEVETIDPLMKKWEGLKIGAHLEEMKVFLAETPGEMGLLPGDCLSELQIVFPTVVGDRLIVRRTTNLVDRVEVHDETPFTPSDEMPPVWVCRGADNDGRGKSIVEAIQEASIDPGSLRRPHINQSVIGEFSGKDQDFPFDINVSLPDKGLYLSFSSEGDHLFVPDQFLTEKVVEELIDSNFSALLWSAFEELWER